ncbi:MAG: UV DNA damage repair endonuclease UvsE [Clostridia bacterium]|nr:UV DNA damage repair endonuclease UvsE [Clostridia bacterium]
MLRYLGYACVNEHLKPEKFKTCRLKSIETKGIEHLKEVVLHNLNFLEKIIRWNYQHQILFYRVSSDLIPLSTHPYVLEKQFFWKEDPDIQKILLRIKTAVKQYHMRISMHPDQYTVLNSFKEDVVRRSVEYLEFHADLLERLGGTDIILHVGGVYGDKEGAKERFIHEYKLLNSTIKGYLRIENDDKSYNIHDVIEISKETGVSVVFDYHHHRCHQDRELTAEDIKYIMTSWADIPKVHLSTGRTHEKDRSHHDYVTKADLDGLNTLLEGYAYDVMIEAKKKEMAVLELRDDETKDFNK